MSNLVADDTASALLVRGRLSKMREAISVKFFAKDHHGDHIFVEFDGGDADNILRAIKALAGIKE